VVKSREKPLKERNRSYISVIIAANVLIIAGVAKYTADESWDAGALLKLAKHLVPVGFALVVSTVLNGLLPTALKERLVFWRWRQALPGHRAFSEYAKSDARVDLTRLEKLHGAPLPTDPSEQNKLWYRLYKTVEDEPAVLQVHRDFLLMRDYTGLSTLFLLIFGIAAFFAVPSTPAWAGYVGFLALQYLAARTAARNYGVRFVTTVLAHKAVSEMKAKKTKTTKK
jgi:hypothetical protein